MTAFGAIPAALDVLYADGNIGEDAEYLSAVDELGEGPKSVRVVIDRQDAAFNTVGIAVISAARVVNVRQSQVAKLRRGDQFRIKGGAEVAVDGTTYEVIGDPEFDGVSGEWTAQVREATFDRLDT